MASLSNRWRIRSIDVADKPVDYRSSSTGVRGFFVLIEKSKIQDSKFRSYEPLLMTQLRLVDAFSGAALYGIISKHCSELPYNIKEVEIILFFLILVILHHTGIYRSWRFSSPRYEINKIILGCCIVYFSLFFILYLLNLSHLTTGSGFMYWMVAWPLFLSLGRIVIRFTLRGLRKKGLNTKKAIIVGANDIGEELAELIVKNPWSGMQLLGFFDDHVPKYKKLKLLGGLDRIASYVSEHPVDIVYISLSMNEQAKIQNVLRSLNDSTVSVFFVPDLFFVDLMIGGHLTYFEHFPVIALQESPIVGINRLVKRLFDILVSASALVLLFPFFVCIGIALKLTDAGRIIFKQWRYGLNGQPILIYKFRTMTVYEDGYDFKQATRNDPRITRLGAFLRKNSLDELPQLLNVLKGDMSLVGPRPHPVAMNETYRKLLPGYMLRHKVKPGITGLAQLNGFRGETDTMDKIESRLKYDIAYIRNWSLWNDVKILFKTVFSGSWRSNAY